MIVALNTYPLQSEHSSRGIGYYTKHLRDYLTKRADILLKEFTNINSIKGVDLVHFPWFDLFFNTLPVVKKFPTVVTIHDVMPLIFSKYYPTGLKGRINFLLQKMSLSSCKYIITDSIASKNGIMKYLNINENKIKVVYLSADENFRLLSSSQKIKIQKKYNLPSRFLLYVGDVNYVKNLPFLIENFASLIKQNNYDQLKLVLVGKAFSKNTNNQNHPELIGLKKVNSLIEELFLEDHIIKLGYIESDDLVGIYNLATVYVQPSLFEGFGIPILEAMACGVPVVSSNGGSLPEVGGKAALYFDPFDGEQFKTLVAQVLNNEKLRKRLISLGVKQKEKFSWQKVVSETIDIYEYAIKD